MGTDHVISGPNSERPKYAPDDGLDRQTDRQQTEIATLRMNQPRAVGRFIENP